MRKFKNLYQIPKDLPSTKEKRGMLFIKEGFDTDSFCKEYKTANLAIDPKDPAVTEMQLWLAATRQLIL